MGFGSGSKGIAIHTCHRHPQPHRLALSTSKYQLSASSPACSQHHPAKRRDFHSPARTGHRDRNERRSWTLSQMQRVSIINLHAVNRSHKFWKLLLTTSPTRNCSNASTTSGPEMSCLLPRASLPWGWHFAGGMAHGGTASPDRYQSPPPHPRPRQPLPGTGEHEGNPGVTPIPEVAQELLARGGTRAQATRGRETEAVWFLDHPV